MSRKPSYLNFDKASYAWKPDIDYRSHPEQYRVGRGEQGVLICQPYKDELVKLWRFKTPDEAEESSQAIWRKFQEYLSFDDFVGADMARKFLQTGFTGGAATPTTREGASMRVRITRSLNAAPVTRRKQNALRSFTNAGKPPRRIKSLQQPRQNGSASADDVAAVPYAAGAALLKRAGKDTYICFPPARRKTDIPTRLVAEWKLPPAATFGSSVRAKGILLEVRAQLPLAGRKLLNLEHGMLTLRVPEAPLMTISRVCRRPCQRHWTGLKTFR